MPGAPRRAERADALGARAQRRARARASCRTSCCASATSCASEFPIADHDEPVRDGRPARWRAQDLDLVPIVDDDGALAGVMTERALARRYIRESREASRLDAPTPVGAIVEVLEGELARGRRERRGRRPRVGARDGPELADRRHRGGRRRRRRRPRGRPAARDRARRRAARAQQRHRGPPTRSLALARERGTAIVVSPLDSYVTGRMITLSAPVPRADGRASR